MELKDINKSKKQYAGTTLIEVVLSLALFSIVCTSIFSILSAVNLSKNSLNISADAQRQIIVANRNFIKFISEYDSSDLNFSINNKVITIINGNDSIAEMKFVGGNLDVINGNDAYTIELPKISDVSFTYDDCLVVMKITLIENSYTSTSCICIKCATIREQSEGNI